MKTTHLLEYSVVALLIAYIAIALTRWPGQVEALNTPSVIAALVVIVTAVGWFSPIVAVFLVFAVAATYLVNEMARRAGAEPVGRIASSEDYVDERPTVWPYLPGPETGSNLVK